MWVLRSIVVAVGQAENLFSAVGVRVVDLLHS
jgi:hypothetical protein